MVQSTSLNRIADNDGAKSTVSSPKYGYHITFCTYCRHCMPPSVVASIDEALQEKMASLGVTIIEHKVMPDHVHLYLPSNCLSMPLATLIGQIKGYISRMVRLQHPEIASLRKLWGGGYFIKPVDTPDYDVRVRRYIKYN